MCQPNATQAQNQNRSLQLVRFLLAVQGKCKIGSQHSHSFGFTLIEVIVAMLILSLFISIAMAGLSMSVVLKVRSRISSEATNWIQQDLEAVRSQSNQLSYTLANTSASGQPYVNLVSSSGLTANEHILLGRSSVVYTIQSISGNTIRLTANVMSNQPAGSRVLAQDKCEATIPQAGFAYVLQQALPPLQNGGTRIISGRTYTLQRNAVVSSQAPHEVLQLTYSVYAPSAATPLTTMYTEVIPNVAFLCPRAE
ncbi:type II secretion system protein [Leptolyngbya sp. FACHB-16]|uniref:type IV pilus modification PilV family protein n=1 Tax=unclassified Leptolyngbya TaxID=2650499 RepID=UPI00168516C7|nr:type II secretion system protein [Leptolyngbya sp. FACHB-16]MBD2158139.1 type II secretion system protein [Leptolyngbya sp. FACHB-16]